MSEDKNLSMFDQKYELPEDRDGFVDHSTGEVVEKKDLTPMDVIKSVAKQMGQEVKDPNPNCNDCYGRGYIGRDSSTKAPIPCRCIQLPKSMEEQQRDESIANRMSRLPRKQRRKLERQFKKKMLRDRKIIKAKIDAGDLEVDDDGNIINNED